MGSHGKLRRLGVRRGRPPVALVIALIALFVALGGGATAAGKVLFTGKQIKNKSITGVDIKPKSIGPKHLNSRALAKLEVSGSDAAQHRRRPGWPEGLQGRQGR